MICTDNIQIFCCAIDLAVRTFCSQRKHNQNKSTYEQKVERYGNPSYKTTDRKKFRCSTATAILSIIIIVLIIPDKLSLRMTEFGSYIPRGANAYLEHHTHHVYLKGVGRANVKRYIYLQFDRCHFKSLLRN